jgi:hypothetical protein
MQICEQSDHTENTLVIALTSPDLKKMYSLPDLWLAHNGLEDLTQTAASHRILSSTRSHLQPTAMGTETARTQKATSASKGA